VAWDELFFACHSCNVSNDCVISVLPGCVGGLVLDVFLMEIAAQIRLAFLKNRVELILSAKGCDWVAFLLITTVTKGLINDTGHVFVVAQRAILLQIDVLGLDEPIVEDNTGLVLLT